MLATELSRIKTSLDALMKGSVCCLAVDWFKISFSNPGGGSHEYELVITSPSGLTVLVYKFSGEYYEFNLLILCLFALYAVVYIMV